MPGHIRHRLWFSLLLTLLGGLLLASPLRAGSGDDARLPVAGPAASVAAKCNAAPGSTLNLIDPANAQTISKVTLENVQVSGATNGGVCHLSGTLRVLLPGNNVATSVEGDVDQWDQFLSTRSGSLAMNIAGFHLQANKVSVFPDKVTLSEAWMKVVDELGGGRIDLQVSLKIDKNGLRVSDDLVSAVARNAFNIPSLKVPSGIQLAGLFADLISEANGYKLSVEGKLWIPYIPLEGAPANALKGGELSGATSIKARFSIYINALGQQTIQIMPSATPERIPIDVASVMRPSGGDAANGCFFGPACLSEVGLSLSYFPGINLDQGYAGGTIWLTGVRGSITLTSHDTQINLGLTIETSTLSLPLLGSAIKVNGDARLQFAPELGLGLRAAMKIFILEAASAEVSYSASQGFRASFASFGGPIPMRFEGEIRVWGSGRTYYAYSSGPVYVTGSGRVGWYINPGEIYESCSWVPCGTQWCSKWIWFFGWRQISYPCGINWCYSCLKIPPERLWLGGGAGDIGRFKGDIWGVKGQVAFLFWSTGVFADLSNGRMTLGNVNGYVLDAPTVLRAASRLRSAGDGRIATGTAAEAAVVLAEANTLILRIPVGIATSSPRELSAMRNALAGSPTGRASLDVITTTNVLTRTDTIFSISLTEALTPSLFTPNNGNLPAHLRGVEITQANYASFAPELVIAYQENYTYTQAAGESDSRWRFASATLTPVTVTLGLDGATVRTDVPYISDYITTTPGLHSLAVMPSDPAGLPPVVAQLQVITGTDSTALLYFNSSNQPALLLLADERTPPSQSDRGLVRFVNVLGNRSDSLTLYVNGQMVGQAAPGNASAALEMAAGVYTAEVRDASNAVVLTGTLELAAGNHRSLIASSQLVETASRAQTVAMRLNDLLDVAHAPLTEKAFQVDQAPVGEWQVKLTGNVTSPTWRLAVLNATNPPVLSNFVFTQPTGAPTTVDASLTLQSDYAPTKLSFFVAHAPITVTATMTNTDNSVTTEVIPTFQGEEIGSIAIIDPAELSGATPIEVELDLSFLESGQYYLWVQVEDGVNPSVNQYAAAGNSRSQEPRTVRIAAVTFDTDVQVQGVAPVVIDHTATFADHFVTTVVTPTLQVEIYRWDPTACPIPQNDPECKQVDGEWGKWVLSDNLPLYYEWTPSRHPDTDGYLIRIDPLKSAEITATQTFTVGDSVYELYDEQNNFQGVVGFSGWRDVASDSVYAIAVGAADYEMGMTSWSPTRMVTVPLGSIGLTSPGGTVKVDPGSQVTVTLTVSMSEDLFFPAELEMNLWNLPGEIDASFVAADGRRAPDGVVSPRGRLAPSAPPASQRERIVSVARVNPDGTPSSRAAERRNSFNQALEVVISAGAGAPEGVYTIPFTARSGPLSAAAEITLLVGDARIFLPEVSR